MFGFFSTNVLPWTISVLHSNTRMPT
jgi:hypothetical protein